MVLIIIIIKGGKSLPSAEVDPALADDGIGTVLEHGNVRDEAARLDDGVVPVFSEGLGEGDVLPNRTAAKRKLEKQLSRLTTAPRTL
jgi:hypothetical protein